MGRQGHPACLDGIGLPDSTHTAFSRCWHSIRTSRQGRALPEERKLMAHSTKNFLIVILASTTAFLIYQFWLLTNWSPLSKVQSVDQRMRLGMRCRLSPTATCRRTRPGQLCAHPQTYSITSSARAGSAGGIMMPSAPLQSADLWRATS